MTIKTENLACVYSPGHEIETLRRLIEAHDGRIDWDVETLIGAAIRVIVELQESQPE